MAWEFGGGRERGEKERREREREREGGTRGYEPLVLQSATMLYLGIVYTMLYLSEEDASAVTVAVQGCSEEIRQVRLIPIY